MRWMGRWADGVRCINGGQDGCTTRRRQRRRGRRASPGTVVELHAVSMHAAAKATPLLRERRGGRPSHCFGIRSCLVRTFSSHPTALINRNHEKSIRD